MGDHPDTVNPCYGQYKANQAPPPLQIPILLNKMPPPLQQALLWSIQCIVSPLSPVMVNISSIGGCGVILQLYLPIWSLLWSIQHHLGAANAFYSNVSPILSIYNHLAIVTIISKSTARLQSLRDNLIAPMNCLHRPFDGPHQSEKGHHTNLKGSHLKYSSARTQVSED